MTPCRSNASQPAVPELGDQNAQQPGPGQMRISETAANSRLKRVFAPNVKGEYKVPMEIVRQWQKKGGKGKKNLQQIFQSCGFNPDRGLEILFNMVTPLKGMFFAPQ